MGDAAAISETRSLARRAGVEVRNNIILDLNKLFIDHKLIIQIDRQTDMNRLLLTPLVALCARCKNEIIIVPCDIISL